MDDENAARDPNLFPFVWPLLLLSFLSKERCFVIIKKMTQRKSLTFNLSIFFFSYSPTKLDLADDHTHTYYNLRCRNNMSDDRDD